jgi:catechol 2,3-dioxygenase-like lactoylglutathione lyase family enzyme
MGFRLVKVEPGHTPDGGWAKHLFYDTGGNGMIAFWELHDETIGDDFPTALSEGVGLPPWVNHIAFEAADLAEIESASSAGSTTATCARDRPRLVLLGVTPA